MPIEILIAIKDNKNYCNKESKLNNKDIYNNIYKRV
jgi:hypothetical protein